MAHQHRFVFACFGASLVLGARSSINVTSAMNTLQTYYDAKSGMYGSYPHDFWTTANAIEALTNYVSTTGDHRFDANIPNTFNKVASEYFASGYFDDQLWFVNAWIRQYEISRDAAYLKQADAIVRALLEQHDAWTPICGGGLNWGINHTYKNSITNVLFGVACSKLFAYGLPGADGKGYDAWAQATWSWLDAVNMRDVSTGLLVDGLNASCSPTGAFWTYTQGLFTRFGVEMFLHTHDDNFLSAAQAVALESTRYFTDGTPENTLVETSCGGPSCGHDGIQFKGVLVRQLGYTARALANGSAPLLEYYEAWLANNSATVVAVDSDVPEAGLASFGEHWQGPYNASQYPWVASGSIVDLFNAAALALS